MIISYFFLFMSYLFIATERMVKVYLTNFNHLKYLLKGNKLVVIYNE